MYLLNQSHKTGQGRLFDHEQVVGLQQQYLDLKGVNEWRLVYWIAHREHFGDLHPGLVLAG